MPRPGHKPLSGRAPRRSGLFRVVVYIEMDEEDAARPGTRRLVSEAIQSALDDYNDSNIDQVKAGEARWEELFPPFTSHVEDVEVL